MSLSVVCPSARLTMLDIDEASTGYNVRVNLYGADAELVAELRRVAEGRQGAVRIEIVRRE